MAKKVNMNFINTSVDDLRADLSCAEANGYDHFNSAVLQKAYEIVTKRGEKTKARLIQQYIKKAIKKERMA